MLTEIKEPFVIITRILFDPFDNACARVYEFVHYRTDYLTLIEENTRRDERGIVPTSGKIPNRIYNSFELIAINVTDASNSTERKWYNISTLKNRVRFDPRGWRTKRTRYNDPILISVKIDQP